MPSMPPDKKYVRKYVFDHFFEHTTAPSLEEVMQKFGLSRGDAFACFRALEEDHHVALMPGTQRILMANPYSAVSTPFRVHARGEALLRQLRLGHGCHARDAPV